MLISIPVSNALIPRMAKLEAAANDTDLYRLYHHATQVVSVIAIPTCLVLAFFSKTVLWVWTGDAAAAENAAPILRLYAVGNGILVLAAFPYYLQYAKGDLRLHLWGNILFASLLVPMLLIATLMYGAVGAAYTWVGVNAFSFFVWVPIVHRRFLAGLHREWLKSDIFQIALFSILSILPLYFYLLMPPDRISAVGMLVVSGLIVMTGGALGSPLLRGILEARWRGRKSFRLGAE